MERIISVWIGFFGDMAIGDPQGWYHPVQAIGWLIGTLEKILRRIFPETPGGELAAGGVMAAAVTAVTGGTVWGILAAAGAVHPLLRLVVCCVMNVQILAARSLVTESMKVCRELERGNVEGARKAVSMIVGRDTEVLTEEGITRAAIETVAENASDGVVAPLFYLALFGPVGGFLYKAVNTMDSMVGYRNDRYLYFGRAAARLDDAVNWIPARLTALFLIASAFLLRGCSGSGAWKIWRRDRRCHKSPNSAQGESACAGALGVQLAGDAWYFGKLHEKPTIGDPLRPVEPRDIFRAGKLMYGAAALALITFTLILAAFL